MLSNKAHNITSIFRMIIIYNLTVPFHARIFKPKLPRITYDSYTHKSKMLLVSLPSFQTTD
ncbi:hypothetical protein EFO83_06390 [Lacticaseibacillus rhamnosus]|nr:hypothetical protein [Lacticaseibacillus rhamnosus]MCT3371066.1 hypothetical protein [Lacticaseibacillus rhamnosus]OFP92918.1 hypothetical protein HMPREF2965_09880 [Lactobacillus sp. HMSC075D02]